jgi:hypothetical protein
MNIIRKIATTLGCLALAASGVFLIAPAAQADTQTCLDYLESQGYPFVVDHFYGCYHAKRDWALCYYTLTDAYVRPGVAARACDLGQA